MKKLVLSALVASSLIMAEEVADKNQLITHTELGFIDTQGNTQTQTFNLDSKIKKNFNKHMFSLTLDAQYAQSDNIETKNKYVAEASYDYALTDSISSGYLLGFKQDKFSGFDYQLYTGPTVKYKAIKSKAHNLTLSANILYTEDQIEHVDETDEYMAYGTSAAYAWQINQAIKFSQDLGYRAAFDDSKKYFAFSKTLLTSKLSDMFSAGISYKIDYVNTLPTGKEHTDKTFTVNLIIDY